jgi:hypothetical protein
MLSFRLCVLFILYLWIRCPVQARCGPTPSQVDTQELKSSPWAEKVQDSIPELQCALPLRNHITLILYSSYILLDFKLILHCEIKSVMATTLRSLILRSHRLFGGVRLCGVNMA